MNTQSGARPAAMEVVAEETRYEGVGHSLRVVRERRGVALTDVSSRLRIRRPYLEAIEAGRFDELPGAVYITGFLRQYAEFLGLEAEQVLKTYQDEADASLRRPTLNFPMPRPEQRTPPVWLVIGALVAAGAIYALWYNHQQALRIGQDLVEAVPSRLAELIPSTQPIAPAPSNPVSPNPASSTSASSSAAPPTAPATSANPAPPTAALPAAESAPASMAAAPAAASSSAPSLPPAGGAAAPATPAPAAASVDPNSVTPAPAPAAVASPAPMAQSTAADAAPAADQQAAAATEPTATAETPAAPASYGALPAESRIQLEATAPAWIQVRGPNNEQIFTRLLNTGERYLVPDKSGLTLLTGNAGGLRIVVDGQALPPLGAAGEVKRGIALDPNQLKAGLPTANQG